MFFYLLISCFLAVYYHKEKQHADMKNDVVILLGSGSYVKDYSRYLKKKDKHALLLVFDTPEKPKHLLSQNTKYFQLKNNNQCLSNIVELCTKNSFHVVGILNRIDSFEILHGQLCEYFGVPGPNKISVKKLANKAIMHSLMIKNDLQFYRPRTIITTLVESEKSLKQLQFPVVMKITQGVKSKGVVAIKNEVAFYKYKDLFVQSGIATQKSTILFEQMIFGEQVTPVMYVNSEGKVIILSLVDVITAREVKQDHMQLVYRTTPSMQNEAIRQKIAFVMQKLVTKVKLKSVMLHPEFFVVGKNIYLIEVNVRIGGFRYKLTKDAYNIDLNRISWDIAMDDVQISDQIKSDKRCTACEVWEDTSGIITKMKIPKSSYISYLKINKKIGDTYIAPPQEQVPIAKFYVTSKENSLKIAKEIRKKFNIVIQ